MMPVHRVCPAWRVKRAAVSKNRRGTGKHLWSDGVRTIHVFKAGSGGGTTIAVRRIRLADLASALRSGLGDLDAGFSHYIFAVLICPVTGICLFALAARMNAWHLIYPILAGFALIGPFAALGLYEFSRRRERGLETTPRQIAGVLRSPALPAIAALGVWLLLLFLAWLYLALTLYGRLFPQQAFADPASFLWAVFTTRQGWSLLLFGNLAGLGFALIVLGTTVVSFPLLLDRDAGVTTAVLVSALALIKNPLPVLAWGAIVAALLLIGALPALAGLVVVLPVLGHSTWHLYRCLVQVDEAGQR